MVTNNIFITGGQVCGDSMIGYRKYHDSLKRLISQRLTSTGGIYINGLYRMGKTSLVKDVLQEIEKDNERTVVLYFDLNFYNTYVIGEEKNNDFINFLDSIIQELTDVLPQKEIANYSRIEKCIKYLEEDDKTSQRYRNDFLKFLKEIKKARLNILLVIDEFDSAKDVFKCKADFELFRDITSVNDYPVCLVTISRQELSLIEHENPNNSSFKGVMYPFIIKGFDDEDIGLFCDILKDKYKCVLPYDDIEMIKFYCGSSPYLWSCIGYEIAEHQLLQNEWNLENIISSTTFLSKIGGFHDSIYKCLEHDKDRKGISFADKLISVILGPSFLATEEDVKLLTSMNYLIDTGFEYIAFSRSFKRYLMETTYNNDILNDFDMLEKKVKILLESNKKNLFNSIGTCQANDNENWFAILEDTWNKLEQVSFNRSIYQNQIKTTLNKFHKNETVLNIMSLEDAMRILQNYWKIFSPSFNNELLEKWETKLKECGRARNPVHHGSIKRIYTPEEQNRIISYCNEIIKQLS